MAPEKPGRHQPYFESRAHRFCPWANDPRRATATRHGRVGTRTQHPEVITRQRRIINLFHILHNHTIKFLEIYTLPTFCPFCLKYFSLWNNALYLVLCNVIFHRHSLKYLLWHDSECFLGLMDNMIRCLGPLLLTWINFNPSMDKKSYAQESMGWNYLSIPKLQLCNFISHIIMGVITYPCWD